MNGQFTHKNHPNPAKLIESLRHLGYDNYSAIADLVDNSWDADAKTVKIVVRTRHGEPEIILADDGNGMDESILDQAIKLGSLVEKDPASDLGKYGMGLVTASLSIARQTIVLTKSANGPLLKAINDVDEIITSNEFISFLGGGDSSDASLFRELLGDAPTGTVVILRKCDNLHNSNLAVFNRILAKNLGRIFRYFLVSERAIFINDEKIPRIDPLKWEDPATEHFCDEKIEVKFSDGGRVLKDTIHIKLAILADNSAEGDKTKDQNIRTQGFYVLRNNREIMDADSLHFFVKHSEFNRFRGEILFSGVIDNCMGVNFTKSGVKLGQSGLDQLSNFLAGQLKTIRTRIRRAQRAETPEEVDEVHRSAEQEIHRKSKLLLTPKAPKELRGESGEDDKQSPPSKSDGSGVREPREKRQQGGFAANCRFLTAAMGEAGVIYEAEQEGRTTIVRWNSDHPFYKRFILDNQQDKGLLAAADYLVYSLACAELMSTNDESVELITNFKTTISINLRTLLG